MKQKTEIILGSKSPRRAELLDKANIKFRVEKIELEEIIPPSIPLNRVTKYLAELKNETYRRQFPKEIILTADTDVIFENQVLGKPNTSREAIEMLKKLSNKKHIVRSGFCISDSRTYYSDDDETIVKFKKLSADEINYYVRTFKPLDKAGSYGIQEWIGLIGVEWIRGNYENVVGLPINKVFRTLHNFIAR